VKSGFAGLLHSLGKKWVPWQKFNDDDLVKYESITLKSVIEISLLAEEVRKGLEAQEGGLDLPVMIVVSEADYTIPAKETVRLFDEGSFGEKSRMIVYSRGDRPDFLPANCYNPDKPSDNGCRRVYYNSRLEYEMGDATYRVSDFSHMSLTLAPDDEHYGLAGDYRYCLQYFFGYQTDSRQACKADEPAKTCLGERSAFGSQSYEECEGQGRVVRRLTANPLFDEMAGQMGLFMNKYMDPSVMLEY